MSLLPSGESIIYWSCSVYCATGQPVHHTILLKRIAATRIDVARIFDRGGGGIDLLCRLLSPVAALRCGKAVQMHYQFVVMHCRLHCLYFNKKAQLSLTNPRDACKKFARFT